MAKRYIETDYWIEDIVYLKVNPERMPGMITGISIKPGGSVIYGVSWGDGSEDFHYACEMSSEFVPDWEQETKVDKEEEV